MLFCGWYVRLYFKTFFLTRVVTCTEYVSKPFTSTPRLTLIVVFSKSQLFT